MVNDAHQTMKRMRNSSNYFQGAKNHGVIMPDANKEQALNQVMIEGLKK